MKLQDQCLFPRDLQRDYPLVVRGRGCWVWDEKGKKYLDGCAGANVTGIGHGVAEIAEVMADQARMIAYAPPHHFFNRPSIDLAEKLIEMAPAGCSKVMLLSGGSKGCQFQRQTHKRDHVGVLRSDIAYLFMCQKVM